MRREIQRSEPLGERVTDNIRLCPDGVYRWYYEMNMLRSPVILLSVWKVLGISFGTVFAFLMAVDLVQGTLRSAADVWRAVLPLLILMAVFFVLSLVSYLILAAMYGWRYIVLFEMTEDYVRHIQMPRQFEKSQALGYLAMLAGHAMGEPALVGSGLHVSAKDSSTSELKYVKVIRSRRRQNTIYLNQRLERNQIYAADADFDFVEGFLLAHCTGAKVR